MSHGIVPEQDHDLFADANRAAGKRRPCFTQQHLDGVAAILRDYPGAQTTGLPMAVRALRDRLGCEDEPPIINFVPDAFRINEGTQEIELFEVEVTHAIPDRKLRDLVSYWFEWESEGEHDWLPILIQVDRFGSRHRRDLAIAYFDMASDDARLNQMEQAA